MHLPDLSKIPERRRRLGLTQSELAEKAGVSQSLIARIEKGAIDPRYGKVARIFMALDEFREREVSAKEIMTSSVFGIQLENTMEAAAAKMKKYDVSQMPVYNGEVIVGSISERTILDQIARGISTKELSTKKVGEFMGVAFPTVGMQTPLSVISALLEYNTAVIVSDRGQIKGVITNADLLKVVHG